MIIEALLRFPPAAARAVFGELMSFTQDVVTNPMCAPSEAPYSNVSSFVNGVELLQPYALVRIENNSPEDLMMNATFVEAMLAAGIFIAGSIARVVADKRRNKPAAKDEPVTVAEEKLSPVEKKIERLIAVVEELKTEIENNTKEEEIEQQPPALVQVQLIANVPAVQSYEFDFNDTQLNHMFKQFGEASTAARAEYKYEVTIGNIYFDYALDKRELGAHRDDLKAKFIENLRKMVNEGTDPNEIRDAFGIGCDNRLACK